MNKNILKLIALLLVATVILTACRSKNAAEPTTVLTEAVAETTEPVVETTEGLVIIEDGIGIWYGDSPEKETAEPQPEAETPKETKPGQGGSSENNSASEEKVPAEAVDNCEYQQYLNMSPEEQERCFESFESAEAFFTWFAQIQAEHEAHRNVIVIHGDASIDLGEFMKNNG